MFDKSFKLLIEEIEQETKSIAVDIREFEYKLEGCDNPSDERTWNYKVESLYANLMCCEEFIGQVHKAIEAESIEEILDCFGPLD